MRHRPNSSLRILTATILACTLVSPLALASPPAWYAADDTGRSSLYQSGQKALDDGRWADAAGIFEQVSAEGGRDVDAALYWQAYAQAKRGRHRQALVALAELRQGYPQSRWIADGKALELEIREGSGEKVSLGQLEDEELKLYAVNSLMNVDPERAVPVLERLLASDHSVELKSRALFVLSQSDSPRARKLLLETAQGSDPELAEQAVEYLGLCDDCGEELRQLYSKADVRVRGAVLESMMVAEDTQGLLQAVEQESDPALREKAIEQLGVLEATAELKRLYGKETSPRLKAKIIEALFLAEDVAALEEIARQADPAELRREAIEALGLVDTEESGRRLSALYAATTDLAVRESILEAFFLQDNAPALIEVLRTEKDVRLRKKALENLSLIDSDEAVDYLLQAIDG